MKNKPHRVDLLFPLLLYFLLSISALLVVLLSVKLYSNAVLTAENNFSSRTVAAYLREKVHSADAGGRICLGSFNGKDCLFLYSGPEENAELTRIYEHDGNLYELVSFGDTVLSPEDGAPLLAVESFSAVKEDRGFLIFHIGRQTVIISTLAHGEEDIQ